MKSIRIRGKRNIDSMEDGKKAVRTGMDNVGDELMLHETQKTMVNKLYLGEDFDQSTTLKRELTRKINSYKGQDVKKGTYDEGKLISFEDTITKLVSSKLLCYYCYKEVKVLFKNVREPSQWTLDRMDNDGCHSDENTIIACMKCNLERRVTDIGKFTFTKRLRIKRTE
jgi:hypothetical protein